MKTNEAIIIYEGGQQVPVKSVTLFDNGVVVTIFADTPEEFTDTDEPCTRIDTPHGAIEVVE